jgi:hypothetical protein
LLGPPEVLAGVVEVEDLLGQVEEAAAGFPELDQRQRVELKQRDVFGQLLPAVMSGH